jgi:radical SAM superfamily enzyme YgiQ (UPF0313 family)
MTQPTKIYLADLAHTYSVDNSSLTVPLNIGYIAASTEFQLGQTVNIKLFKHPEKLLAAIHTEPPEIIGFANYGWNSELNHAIGTYIRHRIANILIVAGGPNIDSDRNNRRAFLEKHNYLDFLVIDGGEQSFAELVANWQENDGINLEQLPSNLAFLANNNLHETETRPLKKVLGDIPSPYLNGHLDEFLDLGMVPMLETNRGCPFKCTFCAWGSASKDLVQRLDFDQTLAEIAYIGPRSNSRNWIVCDANFGILKRDVAIAQAIRHIYDAYGNPKKCHIWLAKNATKRNLEIGEILGDMTVPVMAVQSLDSDVLKNIKRDNISLDTYATYQQEFHKIGAQTYSDLIVPLPGESLNSHLSGLRRLVDLGVDEIQNHNMRLLAGAETNDPKVRKQFNFKSRYRLIHGDAGIYRSPDGDEVRAFEFEESLRSTSSMCEDELFYLRKLHFLVDFCWNLEVYKPLLKLCQEFGVNPIDVLVRLIEYSISSEHEPLKDFFDQLDAYSTDEWFDSPDEIKQHFSIEDNFQQLINHHYEKLNIKFSLLLLRETKNDLDDCLKLSIKSFDKIPLNTLDIISTYCFARFPLLTIGDGSVSVDLPENFFDCEQAIPKEYTFSKKTKTFVFFESTKRKELKSLLSDIGSRTLSKIMNTQSIRLSDLCLTATTV